MDNKNENSVNKFGNLNASQQAFKTTLNSQSNFNKKSISDLNAKSQQLTNISQSKKVSIKPIEQIENDNLYTIDKFYEDYSVNIENEIFPILTKCDSRRFGTIILAIIISIILIAVCVYFLKLYPTSVKVGLYSAWGFAGVFAVWGFFNDLYMNKLKKEVIPAIFDRFPCVTYQKNSKITKDEVYKDFFLPLEEDIRSYFYSCISVDYRNVEMDISETECYTYEKKKIKNLFDGVLVRIKMKKRFNGSTVIKLRKNVTDKHIAEFKKANLSEVKFENKEFLNDYVVYTSNQKEAKYFVTEDLIESFKLINETFSSSDMSLIFNNNFILLPIARAHRWFAFNSLVTTILDEQAFDVVLHNIISLFVLVDYLKTVEILGL